MFLFYVVEFWHSWVAYLVTCEWTVMNKRSQNKPILINFKLRKTYQFQFSNTIHKRCDDHYCHLLLKSKSLDLNQRLAIKAAMPTSSHNCLPWNTWHKATEKFDFKIKVCWPVLMESYQKNMSNHRNNEDTSSTWHRFIEKLISKGNQNQKPFRLTVLMKHRIKTKLL